MRNHLLRAAAGTAASSGGGGGSSIINTDLYIHYDFSDINCWSRQSGTNTNDYTVHNLANDYNDGLLRSRTGNSVSFRNASDSPNISFNSSDGGGCIEFTSQSSNSSGDQCGLVIPGSSSSTTNGASILYNITTVSATDSNNVFNGIGTGPFTIESWFKLYLDHNETGFAWTGITKLVDNNGDNRYTGYRVFDAGYTTGSKGNKIEVHSGSISDGVLVTPSGAPSSGAGWTNWNHLVYSRLDNTSDETKIYLNNSLINSVTNFYNYDYMSYFFLNFHGFGKPGIRQGIVRFYRGKALTASEVTTNWNAQKSRFGH